MNLSLRGNNLFKEIQLISSIYLMYQSIFSSRDNNKSTGNISKQKHDIWN